MVGQNKKQNVRNGDKYLQKNKSGILKSQRDRSNRNGSNNDQGIIQSLNNIVRNQYNSDLKQEPK